MRPSAVVDGGKPAVIGREEVAAMSKRLVVSIVAVLAAALT